jgi:peptidoglycan/LPS O-acetylase OafA/YrhL
LLPCHAWLGSLYEPGNYGVQVFWCISGFIFHWKYAQAVSMGQVTPGTFLLRRVIRLYPLHLLTLLLVALAQPTYMAAHGAYFVFPDNDAWHFLLHLFMASSWNLEPGGSFNGPIWSVSVEVLVYACFFVLLRLFGATARVHVGVLLACVVAKALKVPHPVLDCLLFFYLGGLTALAHGHLRPPGTSQL